MTIATHCGKGLSIDVQKITDRALLIDLPEKEAILQVANELLTANIAERQKVIDFVVKKYNARKPKQAKSIDEQQDPRKATYQRLHGISKKIGVVVESGVMHFNYGNGVVIIPDDEEYAVGADVNTIFAHELGHAVMQKRGISFHGFPVTELKKQVPNWDELKKVSQEYRPKIWGSDNKKISRHANKPNEVISDVIASVLIGKSDFSILRFLPLEKHDLGIDSDNETSQESELVKLFKSFKQSTGFKKGTESQLEGQDSAELIRNVQNNWADVLMDHAFEQDKENGIKGRVTQTILMNGC